MNHQAQGGLLDSNLALLHTQQRQSSSLQAASALVCLRCMLEVYKLVRTNVWGNLSLCLNVVEVALGNLQPMNKYQQDLVYQPVILRVIPRQHMFFDDGNLSWADFSVSPAA